MVVSKRLKVIESVRKLKYLKFRVSIDKVGTYIQDIGNITRTRYFHLLFLPLVYISGIPPIYKSKKQKAKSKNSVTVDRVIYRILVTPLILTISSLSNR